MKAKKQNHAARHGHGPGRPEIHTGTCELCRKEVKAILDRYTRTIQHALETKRRAKP